jgi:hypothetical protein
MFKYISQILNSLTPAQRILGLVFILCSITIITLGPSFINANTTNCEDLKIRVESQNTQILELNKRVTELNSMVLSNQTECTNQLISKEKEIMEFVSQMETELKKNNNPENQIHLNTRKIQTDTFPEMNVTIVPKQDNRKVLKMIKSFKTKINNSKK